MEYYLGYEFTLKGDDTKYLLHVVWIADNVNDNSQIGIQSIEILKKIMHLRKSIGEIVIKQDFMLFMKKNKMKKIIIISAIFAAVMIISFSWFFRTTVDIVSEFEVEAVYYEDEAGHDIHKDSTHFSHFSIYGKYSYVFVIRKHKVMVSCLKTNNYEHSNILIDVKSVDSQGDSIIQIDVRRNGILEKSEVFNLADEDYIYIDIGP